MTNKKGVRLGGDFMNIASQPTLSSVEVVIVVEVEIQFGCDNILFQLKCFHPSPMRLTLRFLSFSFTNLKLSSMLLDYQKAHPLAVS